MSVDDKVEVKSAPSSSTYTRATVVAGGTATLPFGFQALILTMNDFMHAIWPAVGVMPDERALSLGVLITALPAFWASFSIRGTELRM